MNMAAGSLESMARRAAGIRHTAHLTDADMPGVSAGVSWWNSNSAPPLFPPAPAFVLPPLLGSTFGSRSAPRMTMGGTGREAASRGWLHSTGLLLTHGDVTGGGAASMLKESGGRGRRRSGLLDSPPDNSNPPSVQCEVLGKSTSPAAVVRKEAALESGDVSPYVGRRALRRLQGNVRPGMADQFPPLPYTVLSRVCKYAGPDEKRQ